MTVCALGVIIPFTQAQQMGGTMEGSGTGDGSGTMQGPGGYGPGPGAFQIPEEWDIPEAILDLRDQLHVQRQILKESRDALVAQLQEQSATQEQIRAAIEAWRTEHATELAQVRAMAQEIRQWFRENRPERPAPYMSEELLQRREQFRNNILAVRQLRYQLRTCDPDSPECDQLRQQLRERLQERKTLMRNRRAGEGGEGGDRRPKG